MIRELFWPGARVFDHRWPTVLGTVTITDDTTTSVHFDNGHFERYTDERAAVQLGRVAAKS